MFGLLRSGYEIWFSEADMLVAKDGFFRHSLSIFGSRSDNLVIRDGYKISLFKSDPAR